MSTSPDLTGVEADPARIRAEVERVLGSAANGQTPVEQASGLEGLHRFLAAALSGIERR